MTCSTEPRSQGAGISRLALGAGTVATLFAVPATTVTRTHATRHADAGSQQARPSFGCRFGICHGVAFGGVPYSAR